MARHRERNALADAEREATPSRSQRKRDSIALQKLGEELTLLGASELERMPLSAPLKAAVQEWRRIPSHEGRRRQLQYIGRLMREEEDPTAVAVALEARRQGRSAETQAFRHLERLRDELVEAADPGLLCAGFGERADEVRRLAVRAREERRDGAPPRAFRALFRLLRELETPTAGES